MKIMTFLLALGLMLAMCHNASAQQWTKVYTPIEYDKIRVTKILGLPNDTSHVRLDPVARIRPNVAVIDTLMMLWNPATLAWKTVGKVSGSGLQILWGNISGSIGDQTDLMAALNGKESTITPSDDRYFWRGDKTWKRLDSAVWEVGDARYRRLDDTTGTGGGPSTDLYRFLAPLYEVDGDVSIDHGIPTFNANRLQGYLIHPGEPAHGSYLRFDSTQQRWEMDTSGIVFGAAQIDTTVIATKWYADNSVPTWDRVLQAGNTTTRNATTTGTLTAGNFSTTNGKVYAYEFNGYGSTTTRDPDGLTQVQVIATNDASIGNHGKVNLDVVSFEPVSAVLPNGYVSNGYGSMYLRAGALRFNINGVEQTLGGDTRIWDTYNTSDTLTAGRTVSLENFPLTLTATGVGNVKFNTSYTNPVTASTDYAALYIDGNNTNGANPWNDRALTVKGTTILFDGGFGVYPTYSAGGGWHIDVSDGAASFGRNHSTAANDNYIYINSTYMQFIHNSGDYIFDNLEPAGTGTTYLVSYSTLTEQIYRFGFAIEGVTGVVNFSPIGSGDTNYPNKTLSITDSYIYFKTSTGTWKRIAWSTDTW